MLVWGILQGLIHLEMQLSHSLSEEIKASVWAKAKDEGIICSFNGGRAGEEGEEGRRWNTKHASAAPQGHGGIFNEI